MKKDHPLSFSFLQLERAAQRILFAAAPFLFLCSQVSADILKVGPGETYNSIETAYSSASNGDTILVYPKDNGSPYTQPALYVSKSNISFIGQDPDGGRIDLDGAGYNYSGVGSTPRAMFQFNEGADGCVVANFEIHNCTNMSYNGAGFRFNQANDVTVRNCHVHHCDMGVMANGSYTDNTASNILIEACLVHDNGNTNHAGYNHNFYLGGSSITLKGCNVHSPLTGHNIKSRAHLTVVEGCYIHHSENREFDLVDDSPNTTVSNSHALIKGCVVAKDPSCSGNRTVIHFGQDGGNNHNGTLYIVNSTIVTPFVSPVVDLSAPDAKVEFRNSLIVDPTGDQGNQTLVRARNDASPANSAGQDLWLAYGFSTPAEGSFTNVTNVQSGDIPQFVNAPQGDYRLSSNRSDIVDAGSLICDREFTADLRGLPLRAYTPVPGSQMRLLEEKPDLGAFEWNSISCVDTSVPHSPVRLVFVHHSCGDNWLDTGNGNLGDELGANNYFVRDTYYGWDATENTDIGSSTDIGHWYTWFADLTVQNNGTNRHENIMNSLYETDSKHAAYDSSMCSDPGGENEVIMIKSCYPNSNVRDNNSTVPSDLYGNAYNVSAHTLSNCMVVYNRVLDYMKTREDKMFIVVTAPPLLASSTSPQHADNARTLNNWLVNDWLQDANWENRNVYVFDFYNVLTETNNHHRINAGSIEHINSNGDNYAGPYCSGSDNHPTSEGNRKATCEFVPLLNVFYNRWMTRRDSVDTDGDRLPDRWEEHFLGGKEPWPEEDPDGDGFSHEQEFIAGTDPENRFSALKLSATNKTEPCITFFASACEGAGYAGRTRRFRLEQTDSLTATNWTGTPGYTNIEGHSQNVDLSLNASVGTAFFRLRVRQE
jgi:hypothetical protein